MLTRAERGGIAIESEPLEPRRLLSRVIEREAARLPSITIEAELPRGLPIVAGEDTYVEQIVRNMLSNAAKYTPPGTRRAWSEPSRRATTWPSACSTPGRASTRPRSSGHSSSSTGTRRSRASIAGSGIGLFVCASLVEAMGGTIWAKRRPEGGSEFGFTLRVIPDDEGAMTAASAPRPDGRAVAYSASGSVLSGSMPSSRIALAAFDRLSAPQRASSDRVAAAMCGGSISNSERRASRVSLRPKPSVPSDDVVVGQPAADHVGQGLHPVGRGDDRAAVGRRGPG